MKEDTTMVVTYSPPSTYKSWGFFGKEETIPASYGVESFVRGASGRWGFPKEKWEDIVKKSDSEPARTVRTETKFWWLFRGEHFYHSEDILDPMVVKGMILAMKRRKENQIKKALRDAAELDDEL